MGREIESDLRIREYGSYGPVVIVLHGGPAAAGSAAPIARGLADSFRVIEPWQRGSGGAPLTVARHVEDLHQLVKSLGEDVRPALAGESWGAMLALAYAAAHPDHVSALVLVACGTFDSAARDRMHQIIEERMDEDLRKRIERLPDEYRDPGECLKAKYDLMRPLYLYDPIPDEDVGGEDAGPFDARAHGETWADMVRLQEEGVYPAAFEAIKVPVLMLHGAYDPHPGPMIRDSLLPYLPQLEYRGWKRCGHYLWREKAVRGEFFAVMREWLGRYLQDTSSDLPREPVP
jgi:pimeloyl-ACP methyl ester carboxylesterase